MKPRIIFTITAICFALTACATTVNPYQEPGNQTQHATITGTVNGIIAHKDVLIKSIDNKNVSYEWHGNRNLNISPGHHSLVVFADIKQSTFGDEKAANNLYLSFTAQPHQHYTVKSDINGEMIYAWIVDSSGRIVSNKASGEYLPGGSQEIAVPELTR